MQENAGWTDHSLEDLKRLGYPYAKARPQQLHSPAYSVHIQSGSLESAIELEVSDGKITVGLSDASNIPYAEAVIFGTPDMVSRDFIAGSFYEVEESIRKILRDGVQ